MMANFRMSLLKFVKCRSVLSGLVLVTVVLSGIVLADYHMGGPTFRIIRTFWPPPGPLSKIGDVLRKSLPCNSTTSQTSVHKRQNLTIISAYFNLGTFVKGTSSYKFSTALYLDWVKVFRHIQNPLVFYTDILEFKTLVEKERRELENVTKVVFIANRTSLWSFKLRPRIKDIFDNPEYPKSPPQTTLPDYSCVQNAKYELVADTLKSGYFEAEFYAWLDVGYFRNIVHNTDDLIMEVPCNFNESQVAFNCIERQSMKRTPGEIILNDKMWVGGGLFFGRANVLLAFSEQYQKAVLTFLKAGLMNSDQQLLYAMFSDEGRKKIHPKIEIQPYYPEGDLDWWFYLGYLCLKIQATS